MRETGVGIGSAGVGVVTGSEGVGELVIGPKDDDGENLLVCEWSIGFGARDCLRDSRTGDRAGEDKEMDF